MSETKFRVGDKVEAFGCHGTVVGVEEIAPYIVIVNFSADYMERFQPCGRLRLKHKEPSLKLIERPKKKVTKTMYQAICRFDGCDGFYIPDELYSDMNHAKLLLSSSVIALGPEITFEVEE